MRCICTLKHTDHACPRVQGYDTHCCYTQKNQLIAFLLQFFIGAVGAGRFYLGYIGIGVGQLVLSLLVCCLPGCMIICSLCTKGGVEKSMAALGGVFAYFGCVVLCLGISGIMVWWLYDLVIIGTNAVTDFNGVALYPM